MPSSLDFSLTNQTTSDQVFAYVTGIALQHGGQRCLIKSNGNDLYFPIDSPSIGSPLAEDCAIPLGPPGKTTTITVPQIAGGRLWFSVNDKLTFLLNPGPALVEPSVLNPSDPNANVDFGFCEFTLNDAQFYGNISYVDFVPRLPIAISLESGSGTESVAGMPPDGLDRVCELLKQQTQRDSKPWDRLIVQGKDGKPLRALNATHGGAVGASFDGYFESYIDKAWDKYRSTTIKINTQAGPGVLEGRVIGNGNLKIGDEEFQKPSSADVLGCNSGPFTTGPSASRNAIIPRLAAAFVRTTLLDNDEHPSDPSGFYKCDITNHYARIVHDCNIDKKGYSFAYDDVQPDGGEDQSGKVNAGDPKLLRVTVGGRQTPAGTQGGVGGASQASDQPVRNVGEQQHGRGKLGGFLQKVLH